MRRKMSLTEATIKALQGKLSEQLDFEVNNKWVPYDKDNKDKINNFLKQIADTDKPIKYTYVAGYDNWSAVTETKILSLDEVENLFLNSNDEYLVKEKEDCIQIQRIENRW